MPISPSQVLYNQEAHERGLFQALLSYENGTEAYFPPSNGK